MAEAVATEWAGRYMSLTRHVVAFSLAGAAIAWWLTGLAAVAPVTVVGAIAVAAAACDLHSRRIPNELVLVGVVVVAASWGLVGTFDGRMMGELARDVVVGCLLSGAPLLLAIWLVAPHLIGGGDWKLLGVCGLALGYAAPLAAAVMVAVCFGGMLLVAVATHQRHVPLAPAIAAGYAAAVGVAIAQPHLVGGVGLG
jgi:leader peptidase (prepilin peptidase)/N-methyltransferase